MADIKLSICIPTFNRASYLRTLLASLAEDLHQLPWPVEVIVSDNASPDETAEVVAAMEGQLPLRYMRQSENIGPLRNIQKALRASAGEYAVYLADDDRLAFKGVIRAIEQMDANPKAGIYYAPWLTKDLVTGAYGAPFYQQQGQVTVPQGNYVGLLEHVLDNKVFAEISVVRVAVQKHLTPLANDLAFWAFTMPCEYLGAGDVIFGTEPFYYSVSRHFDGDDRAQLGFEEVQSGWDLYRGGLDYLFGLAREQGGLSDLQKRRSQIDHIIIERMLVALSLRMQNGSDPIDTYTLAARLRGLGQGPAIGERMAQIRLAAALQYICVVLPDLLQAEGVAVLGNCPAETTQVLQGIASVPLRHVEAAPDIRENDIVFNLGQADNPLHAAAAEQALVALTEGDLMQKFA